MVQPLPGHHRRFDADVDRTVELPVELSIERRPGRGLLPALVAAAIIIGGGAGGALLLMPADRGAVPATGSAATPAAPSDRAAAPTSAAVGSGARTAPTTLREQASADQATVRTLVERWVPQISSKAPGRVIDGVTYDEARIWSEFRALRAKYPDVVLLPSGDYRSFAQRGHWVTVVARGFADAAAANAWCDRQGFAPDDCFAKRLSRTGGPTGNTVSRR